MPFLPRHLMRLFKKKKREKKPRGFAIDVAGLRLTIQDSPPENEAIRDFEEAGPDPVDENIPVPIFEIFPADPSIRQTWFSLTTRERQVVALVCMGHKNYDIASILGVEYATIQTHLQKVFHKFNLRSRKEIRAALISWPAEEWWKYHHY